MSNVKFSDKKGRFVKPQNDVPFPSVVAGATSNTSAKSSGMKSFKSRMKTSSRHPRLSAAQIKQVDEERKKKLADETFISDAKKTGPTKVVAIDCEMVGSVGNRNMLARVTIVNMYGHVLIDKYVKPYRPVVDYRSFVSGIFPHHLENATPFDDIQREVCNLLRDKIIVGHDVMHDLQAMYLHHPKNDLRDTARYFSPTIYGGSGKSPSLKRLVLHFFNVNIQGKSHDSVEDARATMMIYNKFKGEWEAKLCSLRKAQISILKKKYGNKAIIEESANPEEELEEQNNDKSAKNGDEEEKTNGHNNHNVDDKNDEGSTDDE